MCLTAVSFILHVATTMEWIVRFQDIRTDFKTYMYNKWNNVLLCIMSNPTGVWIVGYSWPSHILKLNSDLTGVQLYDARRAQFVKDPHFNHPNRQSWRFFCRRDNQDATEQSGSALTENVKQPLFQFTNLLLQTGCFIFILTAGVLFFFLATVFPPWFRF